MSRIIRRFARTALLVAILAMLLEAAMSGASPQLLQLRSQMTHQEFARCGLTKLSASELAALESWINRRVSAGPSELGLGAAMQPKASAPSGDPLVAFNTSSHKYHCPSCRYALQCTRNCIEIRQSEAVQRGGVPCGTCGGRCR